jgi:two-component system phosphate regulon sensor histidine kinase PhoR
MRISIFFKAFFAYAALAVAVLSLVVLYSIDTFKDRYSETLNADLEHLGFALGNSTLPLVEEADSAALQRFVAEMSEKTGTRITVIDPEGVVLADSEEDPRRMENHRDRPEVSRALRGGTGVSTRLSRTVGENMHYVAVPLMLDGRVRGVIRVSRLSAEIEGAITGLEKRILKLAALALGLSLLVALVFSAALTRPLRELIIATRNVANGDLDTRVMLRSKDEVRELGDSFNVMTEQLKNMVAELTRRREELESVISAVQDGVVVLDGEGRVLLSNRAFRSCVGEQEIDGKFYWEVIRSTALADIVKRARDEHRNVGGEAQFSGRIYSCGASAVESQGELVVWLHDVTEIKNVERVKKDFIVNLSHELRTPLTAIKGFVEAATDDVGGRPRHYLDIAGRNIDRLAAIVEDLLRLSELEDRVTELEIGKVDLEPVVREVAGFFEQRAGEKNLTLSVSASEGLPAVLADRYRLEQVLINLIDNAVKYTDKGGVTIQLDHEGDAVRMRVSDTGSGIPEQHIPRIFERFYVVDKSRSRTLGGTGLGLSIVKHIVLMHGGDIGVTSVPGSGTTFTVTLPAAR